ncbi:MAG: shikimate dehydrogenase [Actinobacteria bacterium]|nr:shikimate dehydrogenase [Actinomycetota bacterium]
MRLVLLGDPVAHSRSPAIHRAALAAVGLEGSYEARRVDAAGVYRACAEIRAGTLAGANVTMPHKRVAAAAADRLDPAAAACGAVNTLAGDEGEVWGYNTDVGGLRLAREWAGIPPGGPVLVLGGGGAAAAALVAFAGVPLAVATRCPGAGGALAAARGIRAAEVAWGQPAPGALLVNATTLGMHGEPLPLVLVEEAAGLIDLPYGEAATPAVRQARERGLPVADGLEVLVAQAALSFRIWTGCEAPVAVMRRAARGA